jgi:hypothetical protein
MSITACRILNTDRSWAGRFPTGCRPRPGHGIEHTVGPAERAAQEANYGRRSKGYIFGALRPATGEAFTKPYERRTTVNRVDFLAHVNAWLPTDCQQV